MIAYYQREDVKTRMKEYAVYYHNQKEEILKKLVDENI